MSEVKRGPLASFFYGIWTLIRVTNHLALLAMFGFLFIFFVIGLAASADKIFIDPEGGVMLEGLGRYRLYFREGLQEKLGMDVHLFRVGEYKSAMEPYILDAGSAESHEADLFWMNDLWQRYVADIAKARNIPVEQLNTWINNLSAEVQAVNGDLGKLSVQQKLVDGLKTSQEMDDMLSEMGAVDDESHSSNR